MLLQKYRANREEDNIENTERSRRKLDTDQESIVPIKKVRTEQESRYRSRKHKKTYTDQALRALFDFLVGGMFSRSALARLFPWDFETGCGDGVTSERGSRDLRLFAGKYPPGGVFGIAAACIRTMASIMCGGGVGDGRLGE